jgi:hypothetical protein
MFIDDIEELILKGNLQIFADDIVIVYAEANWTDTEHAMNTRVE